MTMIRIFSAGSLAGTNPGGDVSACPLLHHAVADRAFAIGRLKRTIREAFCDKTLALVGQLGWREASAIDCPRCTDLAGRLFGSASTRFRSGQAIWAEADEDDRPSDGD
jgi:phage FluMu protein Com